MPEAAPMIDRRTAEAIEAEVRSRLLQLVNADTATSGQPEYQDIGKSDPLAALIAVSARFAEIVIDRLNRAPDKNFLAYLDLLGVSRLPPQPARVPLTFRLASGRREEAIVPRGTRVAAQLAKDETEPVVFETQRELVVTPLTLALASLRDDAMDQHYSWSPGEDPARLDRRDTERVEHALYIGLNTILSSPGLNELSIGFQLVQPGSISLPLTWEILTDLGWKPVVPKSDTTDGLRTSGEVTFPEPPSAAAAAGVNGIRSRWIRCTLAAPLVRTAAALDKAVPESAIPTLSAITVSATCLRYKLSGEEAFSDFAPVDLTKDFFPFGRKPAFGSTFYLASKEALCAAGATVTLYIELTNPAGDFSVPLPPVVASGNPRVCWEYSTGRNWVTLGISQPGHPKDPAFPGFEDETEAFTKSGRVVTFRLPEQPGPASVNGKENVWLRVRLVGGRYGEMDHDPTPPAIKTLLLSYLMKIPPQPPDAELTRNDFEWKDRLEDHSSTGNKPFSKAAETRTILYLGFAPPPPPAPPRRRSVSMWFVIDADPSKALYADDWKVSGAWQYWDGTDWKKHAVRDETHLLTRSGAVRALPPPSHAPCVEFDRDLYWVRLIWPPGAEFPPSSLRRILVNTVLAEQSLIMPQRVTGDGFEGEVLGASSGSKSQVFKTMKFPVLLDPSLNVREPHELSALERSRVEKEEGPDAVTVNKTGETWVRWHETPDFLCSGAHDRHYVLNHLTGELHFGDGVNGMIPPAGVANIRLSYRTGGGQAGNKEAARITQMLTTVPYIEGVINHEPAEGGVDAEDEKRVIARGPSTVRHGGRAVAREDYEDLAMLASAGVARAKCIPLRNLGGSDSSRIEPGTVSLIVVPATQEKSPKPTVDLLDLVEDYILLHCSPTVQLVLVGPDYLRINVKVKIALRDLDFSGDAEVAVTLALDRYLHPITGGPDGSGWRFGRHVHKSDLYGVIMAVAGVEYISRLDIVEDSDRPIASIADRFLVCSGTHTIHSFLTDTEGVV